MIRKHLSAVLYRVFLCWACVAALALFVAAVDIMTLFFVSGGMVSFDASIGVYFAYFVAMLVAAINFPLIWAIADAAYCAFFARFGFGARYAVAIVIGVLSFSTIYFALTEQYPYLFLMSWIGAPITEYLRAWYSADLVGAEQFSAGGALTYIFYGVAYLVCVSGAFAPVLATYIDRRRITSSV